MGGSMPVRRYGSVFGLAAAGCAVAALGAAFAPPASARPRSFSVAFSLRSSHGYLVSMAATVDTPASKDSRVSVTAFKARKSTYSSAVYGAPSGHAGTKSVKAGFGPFGRISVRFHKTGTRTVKPSKGCHGKPERIERGVYRGTIVFHGEHGYTKVSAHKAKGTVIRNPPRWRCHTKGNARNKGYTELMATLGPAQLSVTREQGKRVASFSATETQIEHPSNVDVSRLVSARGRGLTSDSGLSSARVHAPAPFKGTGAFKSFGSSQRGFSPGALTGDLSVSFPGDPHVSLVPSDSASLMSSHGG